MTEQSRQLRQAMRLLYIASVSPCNVTQDPTRLRLYEELTDET